MNKPNVESLRSSLNPYAPPMGRIPEVVKSERPQFPLAEMEARAQRFVDLVSHRAMRIMVCGSIRRRKTMVGDIDVVAIPEMLTEKKQGWFGETITTKKSLLHEGVQILIQKKILIPREKSDGKTMIGEGVAFVEFEGVPVDLYYVPNENRWWSLVQMRTGSAGFNRKLATKALSLGLRYHADGNGITDAHGQRIDEGSSEQSIFKALGMKYVPPEERNDELC